MLKLINIKINNNYLSADYLPEDSKTTATVSFDAENNIAKYTVVAGYEQTYPTMAVQGLKRIAEQAKKQKDYEIPKEKLVMWY